MSAPLRGVWQINDSHSSKGADDVIETKRVEFTIRKNGITVSASVPPDYFDSHVLPAIGSILDELCPQKIDEDAPVGSPPPLAEKVEDRKEEPMSVRTIAQRLSASTAPEIMKAAAISLAVIQKREKFSLEELCEEVRKATGYWNKTHSMSTKYVLAWLTSCGALVETFDGLYSLSMGEHANAARILS